MWPGQFSAQAKPIVWPCYTKGGINYELWISLKVYTQIHMLYELMDLMFYAHIVLMDRWFICFGLLLTNRLPADILWYFVRIATHWQVDSASPLWSLINFEQTNQNWIQLNKTELIDIGVPHYSATSPPRQRTSKTQQQLNIGKCISRTGNGNENSRVGDEEALLCNSLFVCILYFVSLSLCVHFPPHPVNFPCFPGWRRQRVDDGGASLRWKKDPRPEILDRNL